MVLRRKPRDIPAEPLPRSHHRQFLQLPLIDRYRSAFDALQKPGVGEPAAQHPRELGRARALRTLRNQQNRSARLHDVGCRGHALDALVIREVERVAGRGRDRRVHRFIQCFEQHARYELHSAAMRLFRVSGEHARNRPVAGQRHVQHEIVARHSRNLQELAMQRVVLRRTLHGARIPHEFRTVQHLDGLLRGQPRSNQLPAARIAQHEMRFDETERDVQIGRGESLVDIHGRTRLSRAEVAVGRKVSGVMVHNAVGACDFLSADFANLSVRRGTVQARGNQNGDAFPRNSRLG